MTRMGILCGGTRVPTRWTGMVAVPAQRPRARRPANQFKTRTLPVCPPPAVRAVWDCAEIALGEGEARGAGRRAAAELPDGALGVHDAMRQEARHQGQRGQQFNQQPQHVV